MHRKHIVGITAYGCLLLIFILLNHQGTAFSQQPKIAAVVHPTRDFTTHPAPGLADESEASK